MIIKPSSVQQLGSGTIISNNRFVGKGGNGAAEENGLGIWGAPELTRDMSWSLRFELPLSLPLGTPTLRCIVLADQEAGSISLEPSWASVLVGQSPSAALLLSEGAASISWSVGDNDKYLEARWDLDAGSFVAGSIISMELKVIEATSTHLKPVTILPSIIFV